MPASTKTADRITGAADRWLVGRLSEHQELARFIAEQPHLLVLESDPLSGTSALLAIALSDLQRPMVAVDARDTGDGLDLAMAIATAAIRRFAPRAAGWWNGNGNPDAEGLRIWRAMSAMGIDLNALRLGSGPMLEQLRHALELVARLSEAPPVLVVDHLDNLLERVSARAALEMLGVLRAEHQRAGSAQQLLVGRTGGRLASGLRNPEHPMYRASVSLRIGRPKPQQFTDDLKRGDIVIDDPHEVVAIAAELAAGAPAYVWRIVDGARYQDGDHRQRALAAWSEIQQIGEPAIAQQFTLLGSVHRAAPTVVCALARGIGPYELPLNPKSVNDALTRMRARGQVYSYAKQRWAVSDPLLGSWARAHAPIWVKRRAGGI